MAEKITAIYGGGFKPPHKGHFEVAKQALSQFSNIDKFKIYIGGGIRDGVSQEDSIKIWEIYKKYLPLNSKVQIETSVSPIGDIKRYAKNNSEDKIYFILGAREGKEEDYKDIESRTKDIKEKYPNIEIKTIFTTDVGLSGTNARKALENYKEFFKYLPDDLSESDKEKVFNIAKMKSLEEISLISQTLNENATYSDYINYKQQIKDLTKYYLIKYPHIKQLPKIIFKHGDNINAKNFFGKTAYYDPNTMTIVLYTEGRHPKDIVRSFSHEMIHHIQNVENRLHNIITTNTNEDSDLQNLEKEAYLNGNILFRNWTDLVQEKKQKDYFGLNQFARELVQGLEETKSPSYQIYVDMDGVLCDFDSRVEELFGKSPKEYSREELIEAVNDNGVEFWSKMKWHEGGKELWDMVSKYNPSLLTSPGMFKYAPEGKKIWAKENLSPQPQDIIFGQVRNKHLVLSGKDPKEIKKSILIDDYFPNVKPWQEEGGIGILHKSFNNTQRILNKFIKPTPQELEEIKSTLKEIVYPFSKHDIIYDDEDNSIIDVEYVFTTEKNKYKIVFSSKEKAKEFEVAFGVNRGDTHKLDTFQMTDEGNVRNILQTIAEIINEFYSQYKEEINKIVISGTDEKRSRVYKQFFPKYINSKTMQKVEIK